MNSGLASEIRNHDAFNIVALTFISALNIIYLKRTTKINLIGTPELGLDGSDIYVYLYRATIFYFVVDIVWISLHPKAILTSATTIILHHILAIVFTAIPVIYDSQFSWHMSVLMLLEVNILLMTIARFLSIGTYAHGSVQLLFYTSWVILRLIMLPIMLAFFIYEHSRISLTLGTVFNVGLIAILLQSILVFMSFFWTFEMIRKRKVGNESLLIHNRVLK